MPRNTENSNQKYNLPSLTSDIIPSLNATYNIGSNDFNWENIWLNNNAYVGNQIQLGLTSDNTILEGTNTPGDG